MEASPYPTRFLNSGFTLIELVGALVVGAVLISGFTYLVSNAFTPNAQPTITANATVYAMVPDSNQLLAANNAMAVFNLMRGQADAIVVLGGSGSQPQFDPTGPSSVILWNSWPTQLTAMVTGDPATQFCNWDQRAANATQFASLMTAAGSSADFSVLFLQGLSRVIGAAKQRRTSTTIGGVIYNCYDVELQQYTYAGGSVSSTNDVQYHVYFAAAEDVWRTPPGATHVWYRYDTTWNRDEEAGAFVVFADPFPLAGENSTSTILPVSRFTFFVAATN